MFRLVITTPRDRWTAFWKYTQTLPGEPAMAP